MVTIYDGPTTSDPVLIQTSSDGVKFATISTSSTLLVTFVSDFSYQTGNGWRLDYVRIVHSPFYSYNNGDVTNWNVDIPYAASPSIDVNGGLTLLEEEATGSPSSASMVHQFVSFSCCVLTVFLNATFSSQQPLTNMTDFLVVISASFPNSLGTYVSDGLSLTFGTSSSVNATCSQRYCLNPTGFQGLATFARADLQFTRWQFSNLGINLDHGICTTNCLNMTGNPFGNEMFKLVTAVTYGNVLTMQTCNGTSGNCQISTFRIDLTFDLPGLADSLVYAIGTNNEETSNRTGTLIHSIDFYLGNPCDPHCEHGHCLGNNNCLCDAGWTGSTCQDGESSIENIQFTLFTFFISNMHKTMFERWELYWS